MNPLTSYNVGRSQFGAYKGTTVDRPFEFRFTEKKEAQLFREALAWGSKHTVKGYYEPDEEDLGAYIVSIQTTDGEYLSKIPGRFNLVEGKVYKGNNIGSSSVGSDSLLFDEEA
jgi:hypothetical protein